MTDPHETYGTDGRYDDGVPVVSDVIIAAFNAEPHDFNQLFEHLKVQNPELAKFVMSRTAQLAPGDLPGKERMARLALEIYALLGKPHELEEFEKIWAESTPEPPAAA